MKNVRLAGEAGSADQEAVEELLIVTWEKVLLEEQIFNTRTHMLYQDLNKQTYLKQIVFWLTKT